MLEFRRRSTLATILAVFASVGCTALANPISQPEVELKGVTVVSASLTGAVLRTHFVVTNPNSVAIPIDSVDYEAAIGSGDPFQGNIQVGQTIPAYGSAPVDLDLEISAGVALDALRRLATGERDYQISGTVHIRSTIGVISVTFQEEGTISDEDLDSARDTAGAPDPGYGPPEEDSGDGQEPAESEIPEEEDDPAGGEYDGPPGGGPPGAQAPRR